MKKILLILIALFLTGCNGETNQEELDYNCPIVENNLEVGTINGFTLFRTEITCEMVVGNININGYDFGFFHSGCDNTIDSVGYYAQKDSVTYMLSSLVENEEITVEQIYTLYMCDEFRFGTVD